MDPIALYQSKLTMAERAVTTIPSGSRLSMGMFAAEPPALLKAHYVVTEFGAVSPKGLSSTERAKALIVRSATSSPKPRSNNI